jgi:Lon protease-like protein
MRAAPARTPAPSPGRSWPATGATRAPLASHWPELPLFPLGTVLFPDGLLALKVFEARYLDLMSTCLRERTPFGVVALVQGGEVGRGDPVRFERVGCLAELQHCDSDQPGILQVRCLGRVRFGFEQAQQRDDGLWVAQDARALEADAVVAPIPAHHASVLALGRAVATLGERGQVPFEPPYRYDDAGWVANRWSEILPIPLATRHKLMALPDPQARLQLVDEFLRRNGIVKA